ncbi:bacterial Ig-like domain protein [Histomonas meleagridis]|nr:bacterial Ig-like domain protein [Histomonas meleagridis]
MDIWFSFASTPEYNTTNCNESDNFYLNTFGNTAMVQTGHTGSATSFERKILANTIFYLKQRTNETEFEDHYLNLPDTSQPEINDIVIDQANYLITIEANVGTQYAFKVVAYNSTGQSINESEVVVNVTKGIAYYNYTFSANANCELHDLTNITHDNTIKFTTNDVVDQMYIHVAPTDNKNITGNITTVRLNFSTNTFSQSNTYSQSNTFTQSNSFSESNNSNSFSESNSFTSSFPFGASLSFSFILTIYSSDISSFTQIFRTQYLSDSTLIFYEYSIIHMTAIISFYSDYYTFVFQSLYRISDEPVLNSVSLIGIICGSIALVLIIIGVMVWLFRISKKDKSDSELNGKFSDSLSSNLEKEQQYEMIQTIGEMAKEDDDQWM